MSASIAWVADARGTAMSRSSIGRRATRQPVWASTAAPLISMTGTPDSAKPANRGRGALEQHLRAQPGEARDPLHLRGDRVVALVAEPLGEQREHALRRAVDGGEIGLCAPALVGVAGRVVGPERRAQQQVVLGDAHAGVSRLRAIARRAASR